MLGACTRAPANVPDAARAPLATITDVGPRLVSNATTHVVAVTGENFIPGMVVKADGRELKTAFISPTRLHAVVPAGTEIPPETSEKTVVLTATLAAGEVKLGVVNDVAFPRPVNMSASADGQRVFVTATETDTLWMLERAAGTWTSVPMGDGPTGLATYTDRDKTEWVVVVHEHAPLLRMVRVSTPLEAAVDVPISARASDVIVVDQKAYVTNHQLRAVEVVNLASRKVMDARPVGQGPRALVDAAGTLVVANLLSEEFSVLTADGGEKRVVPAPNVSIIGGHTEAFRAQVMGGKRTRGLAYDRKSKKVLAANLGPNIGPNDKRMEVSMNGGVAVVDPATGAFIRHVALGGVAHGVVVDEASRTAFVSLVSVGHVVALDVDRLVKGDAEARKAELARLEVVPPDTQPRIRPREELGIKGRATDALHAGPTVMALVDGGKTLLALNRLSRNIVEVDVSAARKGVMKQGRTHAFPVMPRQVNRWLGEMTYYSDVGRSGMSCDACHPDGHTGGMLFTKGRPMQVYRSPTMRGVRDTAPYFTPQRLPSLEVMSTQVLAHNRFENPPSSPLEISALTEFTGLFVVPPNPFLEENGALPATLALPDGATGDPRRGMELFDGEAGCSSKACHPGPNYTADQDPLTRGVFHDVGTPQFLPLRENLQDKRGSIWPPVSLLGAWDQFPFLASGAGGYVVTPEGTLKQSSVFPLRDAMAAGNPARHGLWNALNAQQRNDILAFIQAL